MTRLKSSRSRKSTLIDRPCRRASVSAWLTRSRNRARLERPVSESWKAWWCSSCSSRLRSLTSRMLSTMPCTVASSSRLVAMVSVCSADPSGWRKAHSTGGMTPDVSAGLAQESLGPLPVLRREQRKHREPRDAGRLVAGAPAKPTG